MAGAHSAHTEADQAEVLAFLSAWAGPGSGRHFTTHAAHVFIAGGEAIKIKRAVRYPYLDFSTLELRRRACLAEIEVNQANAPEIYLGAVPITRQADGSLAIGGAGAPVEWAVRMRAFDQAGLLSVRVAGGDLDAATAKALADAVYAAHACAPVARGVDSAARLGAIADQLVRGLAGHPAIFPAAARDAFGRRIATAQDRARACLGKRAAAGSVRRVHGDLHLDNVVLWQGRPVLFDAIEFDEGLATIDTFYDLAFLLMDLEHRRRRLTANRALNRYLWRTGSDLDLEGLAALPLLLGLRAGVRALVAADKARLAGAAADAGKRAEAQSYLDTALRVLAPAAPRIVAIGGLSGTGKSTLGAALAPDLGPAPGAVHLRSDLERKALFGAEETARLGPDAYTAEANQRVYDALMRKARLVTAAGHAAIVDAVFAETGERQAIEVVATTVGVPFQGLWLAASREVLVARVSARTGDASDATAAVVAQQLARPIDALVWPTIDAGGTAAQTEAAARQVVRW